MDRRTVKKMLDQIGKEEKTPKKKRLSKLTKYDDLIVEKLSIPRSNKKAAYMYIIVNVDNDIGSYSNFIKYVNNHLKDRIEIEKNKKRLIQKLIT